MPPSLQPDIPAPPSQVAVTKAGPGVEVARRIIDQEEEDMKKGCYVIGRTICNLFSPYQSVYPALRSGLTGYIAGELEMDEEHYADFQVEKLLAIAEEEDEESKKHAMLCFLIHRHPFIRHNFSHDTELEGHEAVNLQKEIVALLRKLSRMIDKGCTDQKNSHVATLKKAVPANFKLASNFDALGHIEPALPLSKKEWGYFHPVTGRLSTPVTMSYDNEAHRTMLQTPGAVDIKSDVFYHFMYPVDQPYNAAYPWRGFMKGELLVRSWAELYHGSAAKFFSGKKSRKSIVKTEELSCVFTSTLAQVATLDLFVLSSDEDQSSNPTFYQDFYYSLMEFLHDPDYASELEDLLEWWDDRMFPSRSSSNGALGDLVYTVESTREAFKAAARRDKRARLEKLKQARQRHSTQSAQQPSNASHSSPPSTPPRSRDTLASAGLQSSPLTALSSSPAGSTTSSRTPLKELPNNSQAASTSRAAAKRKQPDSEAAAASRHTQGQPTNKRSRQH